MQCSASLLESWKNEQEHLKNISSIYERFFLNLAPKLFEDTRAKITTTPIPTLSKLEFDILHPKEDGFYSNLTYTIENFSICYHRDKN